MAAAENNKFVPNEHVSYIVRVSQDSFVELAGSKLPGPLDKSDAEKQWRWLNKTLAASKGSFLSELSSAITSSSATGTMTAITSSSATGTMTATSDRSLMYV